MAVKTALTEEEYLRTSFPGVDQEFDDGELIERAMPDDPHSTVQNNTCAYFTILRKFEKLPFHSRPELRHRVRPRRFLIPDVAVYWQAGPSEPVPSAPPLIVIEILSPEDRMSKVLDKLREYLDWGVPHIWFVDPYQRQLAVYDREGLHYVAAFAVPHADRTLTVPDLFD